MSKGRILAVDPGRRRIGLAISDPDRILASPLKVIDLKKVSNPVVKIHSIINEYGDVNLVIVGNPVSLDGEETPGSKLAKELANRMQLELGDNIKVILWDERLSTVVAQELLHQAGKSARKQKGIIDAAAAAVILQSYLDFKMNDQED